jgi:predicted enzyme related to lactoylglutathione lyase
MKSIDVISIPVSDQQVSKRFYAMLGFKILEESRVENNKWWIRMGLEGCATTITLVTWFTKMPPGCMQGLVLRTDDLDNDLRNLQDHGIRTSKVETAPMGRFFSFKDPDGNGLSFQEL